MKPDVWWAALVAAVIGIGLIVTGIAWLNKPLGSGVPIPRAGYAVEWRGWSGCRFGVSRLNMYAMPVGGGPCRCTPVARILELGPVTVTH